MALRGPYRPSWERPRRPPWELCLPRDVSSMLAIYLWSECERRLYGAWADLRAAGDLRRRNRAWDRNVWAALERKDIYRAGAASTRNAVSRVRGSWRSRTRRMHCEGVPLTSRTLEALDRLPPQLDTTILFPTVTGKHIA
jgi:hypothetical protein